VAAEHALQSFKRFSLSLRGGDLCRATPGAARETSLALKESGNPGQLAQKIHGC